MIGRPNSCLFVDSAGPGDDFIVLQFKRNYHRAAADFAVVVDFRGDLVGIGERDMKLLKTGGAGDRGSIHFL